MTTKSEVIKLPQIVLWNVKLFKVKKKPEGGRLPDGEEGF